MKENDLTDGQLMCANWNRISELSGLSSEKPILKAEEEYRIGLQNMFACGKEEEALTVLRWLNEQTKVNPRSYVG